MENLHSVRDDRSLGELAVDGLTGGLIAGVAMALLLVLIGLGSGKAPAVTLGYFNPAQDGNWLSGLLAHLAVSAVYGTLFGLVIYGLKQVRPTLLMHTWLLGMVYGLLLYLAAIGLIFKAVDAPVMQVGTWQFGAVHLIYGMVLGFWLARSQ
jgi:hypothetical protein